MCNYFSLNVYIFTHIFICVKLTKNEITLLLLKETLKIRRQQLTGQPNFLEEIIAIIRKRFV